MATEFVAGALTLTKAAGADLTGSANKFVKLAADGTVVPITAATDVPYGLLLNEPAQGFEAHIAKTGVLRAIASASIAIGDYLTVSADGRVAKATLGTDTTKYVVGRAAEAAGAAGVYIQIELDTLAPRTA